MGNHLKKLFFDEKKVLAKNREGLRRLFWSLSQSIGRGRLSREGALDVRESRERRDKIVPNFSPVVNRKNAIFA